jgi:excisionase family DNA binding protein
VSDSGELLRYIGAQLTDLKRSFHRDGRHWHPAVESIRLLANSGQFGSQLDGIPNLNDDRLVLTYEDAGRRLSVSERTVKRLVASGELPAVKIGGSSRVTVDDLDAYVQSLDRRRGAYEQEEVFGAA